MKMDPEIKAKWVKALRSGEYEQAKLTMHYAGAYCCLGVLCAISDRPMSPSEHDEDPHGNYHWCDSILSSGVTRAGEEMRRELTERNDGGASFDQIADYIEREL